MEKVPISALVLAHQSARTIEKTLASLAWCEEVVVVDSGSTDGTQEICWRFGARVFHRKLEGFGLQKQFAVENATREWVLIVDSDEVVTPLLMQEIKQLIASGRIESHPGYRIPNRLVFLGKIMSHGGTRAAPIRLFNRSHGRFDAAEVHETVILDGSPGNLRQEMLHYSYLTIGDYFDKFNRYTGMGAVELHRRGKNVSNFVLAAKFPIQFLKRFVFQLGFLDGKHGLLWAFLSALYPVIKYLKLKELWAPRR